MEYGKNSKEGINQISFKNKCEHGPLAAMFPFPEQGTTFMKDFYTKVFPARGTWPRSTFPAAKHGPRHMA
jgi:hypothetical protein